MLEERVCSECLSKFECLIIVSRTLCDYHINKQNYPKATVTKAPRKGRWNSREKEYPKWLARKKVEKAIYYGKLIKPTICAWCKESGVIHGHHDDYEKPLEVEWLCQKCHQELHKHYNREYRVL